MQHKQLEQGATVQLVYDKERVGKIIRLGPEVSEVKFGSGRNKTRNISNENLVRINGAKMAGERLENWFTLNRKTLQQRVDAEIPRTDLTFAEQQLLSAAQERLRSWREPTKRSKMSDTETAPPEPVSSETKESPEVKKPRSKSKPKAKPASKGKAKAAAKPAAKANSAKAAAKKGNGSRIPDDAKIIRTDKENPFREGSGSYQRVEIVLKNSGKTAGAIRRLSGLKESTLNTCKNKGLIKVEI